MNTLTEDDIRAHAIEEFPREACGLIVLVPGGEIYLRCKNIAMTPQEHFVMDPRDRARAEDMGEIMAVVHSHVNVSARPSMADKVMCEQTQLPWYIVHVSRDPDSKAIVTREIVSFAPDGFEAPLIGREFSHGVLDCYTLLQDYYKRTLNVELPYFERRDKWWERGENLYVKNFRAAGFEIISGPVQEHDIVLMQIRAKETNHAGVYIGKGLILQHMMNRLSTRDVYDGYFQRCTTMIVRRQA